MRLLTASLFLAAALPAALAQNAVSWVASSGLDTNPCTKAQPCLTFQVAINHTNNAGEVIALDTADYGPFTVGKSMTIDGGPGGARITGAGASTNCGNSNLTGGTILICVNTGGSGPVKLRNLIVDSLNNGSYNGPIPGITGIAIGPGNIESVICDNVAISETTTGIYSISGGALTLLHVTIDASGYGAQFGNTIVVADGFIVTGAGSGVAASSGAVVTLRNTTINGSNNYFTAGIISFSPSTVTLDNVVVTQNTYAGILTYGGTVRLSNVTITDNGTGISINGGSVISFVNNRIYGNGTNGAPTSSVYQK